MTLKNDPTKNDPKTNDPQNETKKRTSINLNLRKHGVWKIKNV